MATGKRGSTKGREGGKERYPIVENKDGDVGLRRESEFLSKRYPVQWSNVCTCVRVTTCPAFGCLV